MSEQADVPLSEVFGRIKKQAVFIQICNHNYLLADAYHRAEGYKPLLSDYRTLIVDEAHKLPEAAKQMFGKDLCMEDIRGNSILSGTGASERRGKNPTDSHV